MASNTKPSFYANCITTFGGLVAVALRVYSRKLTKAGLGWDDGFILVSYPLAAALYVLSIYLWGVGYRFKYLMEQHLDRGVDPLPIAFAFEVIFVFCSCLTKLGVTFSYVRLFTQPGFRLLCYIISSLVVVWSIASFVQLILVWKIQTSSMKDTINHTWFTGKGVEAGICVFNIIANTVIISLPIRPVWNLHMKKSKRIGLIVLFSLGLGVFIVAVIRLTHILAMDGSNYNANSEMGSRSVRLQVLEPSLSIMCISIPMLHPLWHKFRESCIRRWQRHGTQQTSNRNLTWKVYSNYWPDSRKQNTSTYNVNVDVEALSTNELLDNVAPSNGHELVTTPPTCITVKKSFELSWEAAALCH
ncbi:hypothetical protein F5B20DRAFT_557727 [Whalleya microplaca]|nr:hypothetical protein F5B20DRAFT_557727 [Whalleya microplaca]